VSPHGIAHVVRTYIREHPEQSGRFARSVVLDAVVAAFPCKAAK
jgi:hypothetical protein